MEPDGRAAVVVLREHDAPNRLLPIIVGGAEATSIAVAASGATLPRPITHDLMATLVESLDAHVDAVEVTDLEDGAFLANLSLSGPMGERRLDTRPSDAIALAIRLNAPLYVSEHVLDTAGTLPMVDVDDDEIDAEIDRFRDFIDELEPADFATDWPPPSGPAAAEPDGDPPQD